MPFEIIRFEETPNPNAVKCWLDRPISEGPRSFLNADMAAEDPIALALFEEAGITTALFNGDWVSVNKPADASWKAVKERVRLVLATAAEPSGDPVRGDLGRGERVIEADDAARIAALEAWFRANARDLPWRRRRTGYTALVSEAMLQQTQVARVVDRYRVFLRRFPTVRALAEAGEQDVLALWQGLGYYRRARSLHAAARRIVDDHGGRVPRDAAALRGLPGVGRYTAGAIASIAFGRREPIVDGNVVRVLARWSNRVPDEREQATNAWGWTRAAALVAAAGEPGAFNEAMMELGATVCTPAAPSCDRCPVAATCAARAAGTQDEIPPAKRRPERTLVRHHAVIIRRGARILLEQRPATGLWSGLWQPPTVEAARRLGPATLAPRLPVPVTGLRSVGGFEFITTHRRVEFRVFEATSRARRGEWRGPDDVADLPMSNAHRRVLAHAEKVEKSKSRKVETRR